MCHPVTASTVPARISASTFLATLAGAAPPSTGTRLSSRPSTPPSALISSIASVAQLSQDGPKMPAGPCSGITSAMESTSRLRGGGTVRCCGAAQRLMRLR